MLPLGVLSATQKSEPPRDPRRLNLGRAGAGWSRPARAARRVRALDIFLPEPEPREVRFTVISVDDHVVEPRHMFEGRVPTALADRGPRIVETAEGHQVWEFEGERYTQVGMNAVAGRRPETY